MTPEEVPLAPWRSRKQHSKRARPSLGRQAIVAKALEIVDAEGVDAVSMRRLASEFDTGAASLYAYVASKDELLSAVYELALEELPSLDPDQTWQKVLRDWAGGAYELYGRHQDLARLSFADIPTGPAALDVAETVLHAMISQGVEPADAAWMIDRLSLYVGADAIEGHILRQRFNADSVVEAKQAGADWISQVRGFFDALPESRYPTLKNHLPELLSGEGDTRFWFGVDVMIAGIEARNPNSMPPAKPATSVRKRPKRS